VRPVATSNHSIESLASASIEREIVARRVSDAKRMLARNHGKWKFPQ
jgi:hypothetical protein